MSDVAIHVEKIGKKYTLGTGQQGGMYGYKSLRDAIAWRMGMLKDKLSFKGHDSPADAANNDEFWALKDVSFEVKQGDVVGIIGRNGSGKSTLLKILSRITEPTEGSVQLHGRVGSLLEVGTGFHPELTGRENIYMNGAILGMRKTEIDRKFDEIVAFAETEKFLDTPVKRYSSGMYVRLAFAVAAHLEPEILLVDEVLAVGDAAFQKKCLGKMGEVAKGGRTVLFVSHNMGAVEQLCNSAVLLQAGILRNYSSDVRYVINEYRFSREETGSLTRWVKMNNRYSNRWFTTNAFYLSDQNGQQLQFPVSKKNDVWINIDGEVAACNPALTIGYAIYAEDGTLLYWTYQSDSSDTDRPILKVGECTLRSNIPVELLNEGRYTIELIGGIYNTEWFFEPRTDVPTLMLDIEGGLGESKYWTQRRPGVLAPNQKWLVTCQ